MAAEELRDRLQTTLGSAYTIERELGGGGMSRVFVARDATLRREVVVKVLPPELLAGVNLERFRREILVAAGLQNPHIVPVHNSGEMDGLPWFTMPFVQGESLRDRLTRGPLPIADTLSILRDVAKALVYAHERGVVHRDIKPDNVLLTGGTAVVTDFGIAKALSVSRTNGGSDPTATRGTLTQAGMSIGTPLYMAPEQAAADPDTDARADIYAFGCMAYEMLAGRPPFSGRSPQQLLAAHMSEDPQPVSALRHDTPPVVADLVMHCLAKDPAARPASAADVVRTLDLATTSGTAPVASPELFGRNVSIPAAIALWAFLFGASWILAKAAIVGIGLPDWVLPGALIVAGLGLPAMLLTALVQRTARRTITQTPARTPGGTVMPHSRVATIALKASPHVSWKRTARAGLIAFAVFALIVAAFMGTRALGIGPAGSLFAAGRLSHKSPVLITDFTAHHTDSSVAAVVAEGVRANLGESGAITLESPTAVAAALQRMELPRTSRVDLALARQVAPRVGAPVIVDGDITGLGAGFAIALRLVTADSGTVLASYQTTVNGPADLIAGIDVVSRKLRAKIGESLRSIQSSPSLADVTTGSVDALRAYTEGYRANEVELNYPRAVGLYRQAVAIDTGFAMAWSMLSIAMGNAGYPRSAVDSAGAHVFALRARLPDRERLSAEATYYMGPGHDRAKVIQAFQTLLRRGDSTAGNLNDLAVQYASRREYALAESCYVLAIRREPEYILERANLTQTLANEGKFAQARREINEIVSRAPTSNAIPRAFVSLYLAAGMRDSIRSIADTATTSRNPSTRRDGMNYEMYLAMLGGRLHDASLWNQRRSRLDSVLHIPRVPLVDTINAISIRFWYEEQPHVTVQRLDALLAAMPMDKLAGRDRPYLQAALVYARAGRVDRARAMLAEFARLTDTALVRSGEPAVHRILGEVALVEERPRDAVLEFRKSDLAPDGPVSQDVVIVSVNLARAFDAADMADSAITYFERFVHTPYASRLFDDENFLAFTYKRLGELYEAKGDRAKAMQYDQLFVDLWEHADPELQPRVAEVKRRLARLQKITG